MTNLSRQEENSDPYVILDCLPHPVLLVDEDNFIRFTNLACEEFFKSSSNYIGKHKIDFFLPFGSPIIQLIDQVRHTGSIVNEYAIDISTPRLGREKVIDVFAAPFGEAENSVVLQFHPKSAAEKLNQQLTHRNAARSVTGLASMLAHEIKNPLSGIRGAAQLLEMGSDEQDRTLTQLIKDETDRIVHLVDRMEIFSDERPLEKDPVNIHSVLGQVKIAARSGFGSKVKISEVYDPSLPLVIGNRDQLIQVFLNLVKNAVEASSRVETPHITISTGFRSGLHLSIPGNGERVSLPIEICIQDNGPGVSEELRGHIFDPFVTTKTNGTGLGLALVAKIIGDHGGMIECESSNQGACFRILLPVHRDGVERDNEDSIEHEMSLSNKSGTMSDGNGGEGL